MGKNKTLLCILGPTAVGKTAAAIKLARELNTEIISADSRQFYKEISIGTAKPSQEELAAVPHHFIGHLSIHQTYNAGDFERDALAKLDELFTTHDTVIAVGGSGLYVKALIDGLDQLPLANEALRDELNALYAKEGIEPLQQRLQQLDAEAYAQTEIQNPQLNLERELLYDRINTRVDLMMEQGLLEEVKSVFAERDNYALQTVGYKELFEYLEGKHDLEKAVDLIKQHTRNFAKRQLTWFRKEAPEHWFEPGQSQEILRLL
jgi:tRNA dimethylallyltransferase